MQIGQRVFAIGGYENVVEEYNYKNDTWNEISATPIFARHPYSKAIAVPASLFSNVQGGCQGING